MASGFSDYTLLPLGTQLHAPTPPSPTVAGFFGLLDFSGLPSGQAFIPIPPVSGTSFFGLDFTGIPTGQAFTPVLPPTIFGFVGVIDWTGLPVGAATGLVILPPRGHGFRGAGRYANAILQEMQERRKRRQEQIRERQHRLHKFPHPKLIRDMLMEQVTITRWEKDKVRKKQLAEAAIYTVLMAEV